MILKKVREIFSGKKYFYVFILLLFLQVINNAFIVFKFPNSLAIEEGGIRKEILRLEILNKINIVLQSDENVGHKAADILGLLRTPSAQPQTIHFITACCDVVFGDKYSTFLVNTLFYVLFVFGTYLVARKLYSEKIGIISSFLVSLYPAVIDYSKVINLDLPLGALSIFSLYLLLCADNFKNLKYCIFFGISLGIGILIKASILIFLFPPLLLSLIEFLKNLRKNQTAYRSVFNLIIVVLFVVLISSFWWLGSLNSIFFKFTFYLNPDKIKILSDSIFSLPEAKSDFVISFVNSAGLFFAKFADSVSYVLACFFSVGLFFIFRSKSRSNFLVICIAVPVVILSLSTLKLSRYFIPILPLLAIVTSAGISSLGNTNIRRALLFLLFVFSTLQFIVLSYYTTDYRHESFYSRVYGQYDSAADKFAKAIIGENKPNPNLMLLSQTDSERNLPLLLLRYFIMRDWPEKESLPRFIRGPEDVDFVILALDRRYFFKIAYLLEQGRRSGNIDLYHDLCAKYLFKQDEGFVLSLLSPGKIDYYVRNIKSIICDKENKTSLGIYDKLLILEGIKKGIMTIAEVKECCRDSFNELFAWSKVYSDSNTEGLIKNFTFTSEEFQKIITKNDKSHIWPLAEKYGFVFIKHEKISDLGIDLYLFKRTKY